MTDYKLARRHLMRADPKLGVIIKKVGPCELHVAGPRDPFETLDPLDCVAATVDEGGQHDLQPLLRPVPQRQTRASTV